MQGSRPRLLVQSRLHNKGVFCNVAHLNPSKGVAMRCCSRAARTTKAPERGAERRLPLRRASARTAWPEKVDAIDAAMVGCASCIGGLSRFCTQE